MMCSNGVRLVKKHEFRLDGKLVPYDACSKNSLSEAKAYYEHFEYIGSSKVMVLDGKETVWDEPYHFFRFKKD